ncbi:MAG: AAA family ATPase, partial [Desulfobacterales bacterium]|nr:AAA family ATPase [Desulfobacterales bacterium]
DKKKAGLEKLLAEVNFNTSALMDKKLEFDRLNREVDSYNKMAALLERKNQEALIAKAETPEEVTIVRPALLPIHPNNPPKTTATGLMGLIIGFILGMVLAFITETFDTSLAAIEDVEETIGSQVLGIIPHWDLKGSRENLENKEQKEAGISSPFAQKIHLAAHFIRNSMLAETFRSLLTNIKFRDLEKKAKTIAVTSASPQEGKTMVCTNLAIIMAQAGMKTLLIGSDLRKPRLSKIFGVDPVPGLADVLLGNYHWRDAVKTISDIMVGKMEIDDVMVTPGLDNLHFITCGTIPPNPGELLNSERLTDFIEETKNEYDIVIFDVPPILSTADSIILGTKVDAVLLVYRVGNISRRVLKRATIQLSQVKINVMGVVLNGMKAELSPDFHDFKRYQYYYSQDDTKDKKDKKI